MSSFTLTATPEEMKSHRALKVIVTAKAASLTLDCLEAADVAAAVSTPFCKSMALSFEGQHYGGTSHHMMRTLASYAAASTALLGDSNLDKANVDGWMSFIWSSVDLPVQLLLEDSSNQPEARNDLNASLDVLDKQVDSSKSFLVGNAMTIADIALVVSLDTIKNKLVETSLGTNLDQYFKTMMEHDIFQTTLGGSALTSEAPASAAKMATSTSGPGLQLHGASPPVVNNMYRRHRIRIKEVLSSGTQLMGKSISVAGWTRTVRNADKGQLLFVELNDGSTGQSLQCVLSTASTEGFDECKASGGTGSSFSFTGTLIASQGAGQAMELQVTVGKLLGAVYGGNHEGTEVGGMLYPMSKKAHTLEYMRENAHLRPRGRIHAACMRIRHAMAFATHNFFNSHGFLYIHTPIITCADCEGAGEQFGVTTLLGSDHHQPGVVLPVHEPPPPPDPEKKISKSELKRQQKAKEKAAKNKDPNKPEEVKVIGAVDYSTDFFSGRANLTVSGQLNVETHACALSDVYTFGPTFRAENSHTTRHLCEFWMIEPEIAFAELKDDINLAEDYLKYCVKYALENCADDLEFLETNPHGEEGLRDRLRNVVDNPFKRLTYTEAIEVLKQAVADGVKFEEDPYWGMDLPSEHERYLAETVYKMPVVLTDYPKEIKAFYMKLNDDGKTVAAMDILVPKIGEIIGGSEREYRQDVLVRRCIESGLDPKVIWWYVDLRKYGTVPHAGFGLGFERLILFVTGLQNIRDVIPFPRWPGNAEF